jgi:hypothetical protein
MQISFVHLKFKNKKFFIDLEILIEYFFNFFSPIII